MLHKSERLNTHLHIIEFGWHSWVPPSPLLKCTHYSPFLFCCQCMVQFIVIFGVEQYKDVNVIQYLIMGLAASVKNSVFYSIHLFKKFCPIVVVVVVFFFNCVWFWYRGILSLWKGFIVAGTGLKNYLKRKNCQLHLNQTFASQGLDSNFEGELSLGSLFPSSRLGKFWNSITCLLLLISFGISL